MLETDFFFIDDTNIFDQENMPKKDKKLIMDLIDRRPLFVMQKNI